ncbi:molecular chaperone [Pseudomonas sp. A34-9]|uniref:fimbrial biogenesis chaperone n=1 Tax=Pseudomonas sp. A34-9 TaxID=3034675 RepID=UPI00240E5C85|nr:molecular chaperone [Pseudomonas sp. A34-9]
MIKQVLLAGLLLSAVSAQANIVINGTRVIYPEANKDVIVQLVNNGSDSSLVQAWVDDGDINSTPETANVPFLLSPPVVKVSGDSGQQLRITKIGAPLVADRESVFFLNVLDIPPTPENLQGANRLQLAIKSRIKMFYRPSGLKETVSKSVEKVELQAVEKGFNVINKGAYFFTLANIDQHDKKHLLADSVMVAPFSSAFVESKEPVKKNTPYIMMYIDDLGAYKTKAVVSH